MGECACHPEVDTPYRCQKHGIYLCQECLECRDPEIYCKFRTACPIWFMNKKGVKDSGTKIKGLSGVFIRSERPFLQLRQMSDHGWPARILQDRGV